MTYQIVLSRNEYGAFRATPPNLVVHLGDPPHSQEIVFRNISNEPITITLDAPWSHAPSITVLPTSSSGPVTVPSSAPEGQYFYRGRVGGGDRLGYDCFKLQGGSGPGIIITP